MKNLLVASLILAALTAPAQARHHCAEDAAKRAGNLLKFHYLDGAAGQVAADIDRKVTELMPISALQGKGKFDVLEIYGYIYKGTYRMRFIYARFADTCTLMGQEIIETSDPY